MSDKRKRESEDVINTMTQKKKQMGFSPTTEQYLDHTISTVILYISTKQYNEAKKFILGWEPIDIYTLELALEQLVPYQMFFRDANVWNEWVDRHFSQKIIDSVRDGILKDHPSSQGYSPRWLAWSLIYASNEVDNAGKFFNLNKRTPWTNAEIQYNNKLGRKYFITLSITIETALGFDIPVIQNVFGANYGYITFQKSATGFDDPREGFARIVYTFLKNGYSIMGHRDRKFRGGVRESIQCSVCNEDAKLMSPKTKVPYCSEECYSFMGNL